MSVGGVEDVLAVAGTAHETGVGVVDELAPIGDGCALAVVIGGLVGVEIFHGGVLAADEGVAVVGAEAKVVPMAKVIISEHIGGMLGGELGGKVVPGEGRGIVSGTGEVDEVDHL